MPVFYINDISMVSSKFGSNKTRKEKMGYPLKTHATFCLCLTPTVRNAFAVALNTFEEYLKIAHVCSSLIPSSVYAIRTHRPRPPFSIRAYVVYG